MPGFFRRFVLPFARFPRGLHPTYFGMLIAVVGHAWGLLISLLYELVCLRTRLLLFEATCQFTRVGGCEPVFQGTGLDVDDNPFTT